VVAALAAVVIVLRAINRNGDKIDDYITALTALRAEVVALKLEGHPTLSVQEAVLQLAEAKRVARFLGDACSKASLCEEVAMIAEALCNQQGKALSESQQPIRVRDAFSDAVALHDSLLEDVIPDADASADAGTLEKDLNSKVREILDCLPDRDNKVVSYYYGIGIEERKTLKEISEELSISPERCRQIIERAKKQLLIKAKEYGLDQV
jgi:RNA polymerase sigma factor (sigma-70 family)